MAASDLGPLEVSLIVVFVGFLFILVVELYYLFLHQRKKQLLAIPPPPQPSYGVFSLGNRGSGGIGTILHEEHVAESSELAHYGFCWKMTQKMMTVKKRKTNEGERLSMPEERRVDCQLQADKLDHQVDIAAVDSFEASAENIVEEVNNDDDGGDIMHLEGLLSGPPRLLYTISEETAEELREEEDGEDSGMLGMYCDFSPSVARSESVSTTPFITPPSSPFPTSPCSASSMNGRKFEADKFFALDETPMAMDSSSSSFLLEDTTFRYPNGNPNPNPCSVISINSRALEEEELFALDETAMDMVSSSSSFSLEDATFENPNRKPSQNHNLNPNRNPNPCAVISGNGRGLEDDELCALDETALVMDSSSSSFSSTASSEDMTFRHPNRNLNPNHNRNPRYLSRFPEDSTSSSSSSNSSSAPITPPLSLSPSKCFRHSPKQIGRNAISLLFETSPPPPEGSLLHYHHSRIHPIEPIPLNIISSQSAPPFSPSSSSTHHRPS